MGAPNLYWFEPRSCWRFRFVDPRDGRRRFLFCTPDKFQVAGIDLDSEDVVRRKSKASEGLAKRLQSRFLSSLACWEPEPDAQDEITITRAIETYFDLYTEQAPGYRKTLRKIFEDFRDVVGERPVDALVDEDLKLFERSLALRVGRTTVRSYMRQLAMLIQFCVKKGWITRDPRLTYKLPKEELRSPNPFDEDELACFFAILDDSMTHGIRGGDELRWIGQGLLHLGLRPVELQHARWENVDWNERFLFIAKSHGNKEPQALQHQPIPLAIWPEFLSRRQKKGLIFTAYQGGEVTPSVFARALKAIAPHLPGFQWKRFRKTYATILERAGNDIVVVSRLLRQSAGGKNVTIAQRHYIGRSLVHLRDVVDEAFAASVPDRITGMAPRSVPETWLTVSQPIGRRKPPCRVALSEI